MMKTREYFQYSFACSIRTSAVYKGICGLNPETHNLAVSAMLEKPILPCMCETLIAAINA
jgi:hypothetical protein